MNVPIDTIRQWVARCNLEPLSADDVDAYVPFDDRGVRGANGGCVEQVLRVIQYAERGSPTCQLFTGFPGSGKTTELRRLQRKLEKQEGDWTYVVFIDALEYVDRYTPLTITDVLRMLAWHLDMEATRAEGREWSVKGGYAERLWRWLQSDVDINKIGLAQYGVSLMAEIRSNPAFREKADTQLRLRFQEFAGEARDVVSEAVARIRRRTGIERVVVIVDGLEKLTAVRAEDRDRVEQAAEGVFGSNAEWLHLDCHVVYTVPLWLRYRMSGLGSRYDGEVPTLPMIKVTLRPEPAPRPPPGTPAPAPPAPAPPKGPPDLPGEQDLKPHEAGIDALLEMIARRVTPVEEAFGPDWRQRLRPLILAAGGYPRDVLRLVRDALRRAPSFPVPPETIERSTATLAEEYHQALLSANMGVLRSIARDRALPAGVAELRSAAWLFDHYLVLTYRNGEEWYDVHPLVRRSRLFQSFLEAAATG